MNDSLGQPPAEGQSTAIVKRCSCGASYTLAAWSDLVYRGESDDQVEVLELRDCASCRSTIGLSLRDGPDCVARCACGATWTAEDIARANHCPTGCPVPKPGDGLLARAERPL